MLFEDINEYMKRPREERRKHLLLDECCIEIGGLSQFYRGLLAHHLGTTIGDRSVYVCHACNNPKCSNPNHLYWGSPTDNIIDQKEAGTWKSGYRKMIDKYGEEKVKQMLSSRSKLGGKAGGGHNRLTAAQLQDWKNAISSVDPHKRGWIAELGRKMDCTHTQVKRILNKYFPEVLSS